MQHLVELYLDKSASAPSSCQQAHAKAKAQSTFKSSVEPQEQHSGTKPRKRKAEPSWAPGDIALYLFNDHHHEGFAAPQNACFQQHGKASKETMIHILQQECEASLCAMHSIASAQGKTAISDALHMAKSGPVYRVEIANAWASNNNSQMSYAENSQFFAYHKS